MISVSLKMLHSLKPFQCPNCSSSYSTKDASRFHNLTKFPRILTCSHSVCENCLQSAEKNQTKFCCPICKETFDFSDADPSSKFLPDIYALGVISANMKNSLPSLKVKMVPSSELKRSQSQDYFKKTGTSIICGNCNQNPALWQCDECQLNFCSLCFKEIHNDRSKKRHEGKKIFAELYNSMVQEGCPEHDNKTVEFYCEVDNQLTCSYCMLMGSHVGHEVKTLVDKNKLCANDLKNNLEDITNMQKQLKYTDYLLCEIIPKERVDISDTIKNVHDYFHTLHATLQMREAELIAELTEISQRNVKPLEDMRLKVTSFERELACIKKDAESVIENPCLAISAPAVLKKLEESKNLPCYLVPLSDEHKKKFKLDINLDSDLEKRVKEFGEIHFDVRSRFALLPSNDLPEHFCKDIPESFIVKLQAALDTESCSDSCTTFSEDSLSVTSSNSSYHQSMQASLKCRDFSRMQPEKVIVSYIKGPSSFYIQRFSELRKLTSMSDAIDKWCKCMESKKSKVLGVETGDLYLVRYSVDNKWYRGRVKSILNSEDTLDEDHVIGIKSPVKTENGKIIVKDKELRVEVFYIDYGNTEIIPLSNMKAIQPRFLNLPGMAKECCLADIEPTTGGKWSAECITTFKKFVDNKPVVMQVFEERNNVYHVDLCQSADNHISSDVPVSVRDALVFLELAVFGAGMNISRKKNKNERNYMPPESLCVNANICAIVSHVEDPSYFYVQQMSTASYLSSLIYEMNETYNRELNDTLYGIYAPRVGMVCAAQFSLDKQWYRAKVIGLPGGAQVKVQYVDFGNTEVIHHKRLRKLFDKFFKLNIQAIPCKLAQVTYNQARRWSSESKEWLTKRVSRKQLTLKSLGMIPGENKPEVVLYYIEDTYEICVNALMVEQGLAESTGEFSSQASMRKKDFPKTDNLPTESVSPLREMASFAISPPVPATVESVYSEEVTAPLGVMNPPHVSQSDPSAKQKSPLSAAAQKRKYPSLATPLASESTNHIEVHVSHVKTPGLFYIRIAGENEKRLNKLMSDFQNVYENHDGELLECTVGKSYAVFNKIKKKWFRGTVLSKISEDKVQIHYVDYGDTEEVEMTNLRKLVEEFVEEQSFSVRCHLDGINPAGDSTKWPHTACDRFQQLVAPHEILLLSSKGEVDTKTNSLPADLLIEELLRGGALEPTKIEYISITAELINKGLGLPIRRKCVGPPACIPSETPTCKEVESAKKKQSKELTGSVEIRNETDPIYFTPNVSPTVNPAEEKLSPSKPTFQWKPAVPPLEPEFKGFVTNIGDDGSIQLYVLNEGTSQVDTISKALQFKYTKSEYECLKKLPPIGEACIAKFSVDNNWYRAEVISLYPGKVKVNFVDYGNNEIVPLSDLRSDIIMKPFPRQCQECALFGINGEVNGKWDTDLLTFLHTHLVETEVTVEIKAPSDAKGRLQCKITSKSGMDIAEILLSMGFGELGDNLKPPTETEVEPDQITKTFARPCELRAGDIFPVCITQVNSENIVYLQCLKIPDPKDEYEKKHNETHDLFLELIAELREKAEKFPKVKEPMPSMPCCAKYSYDNAWYRCEVTDLTEDGAVVLYVDYGNSETISNDNLRDLESHFIDFPVQIQFCELHGVKPVGDDWDPQVRKLLVKTLLVTNQELYAKVVVPGNISQVDLLLKSEDGKYKLAYDELIEKKLIVLNKDLDS